MLLFESCQKEEIPDQITAVSAKAGNFDFLLSFASFGDEISTHSIEKEYENTNNNVSRSSTSESIVIPVDDNLNIYATLSANPVEMKYSVTKRNFKPDSKIRIVAYENSVVVTEDIFIVNGDVLKREGEDDARFFLPPGDYVFVAYSLNSDTEYPPAIAPVLEDINPSDDLIWGVSAPIHLYGEAIEVPIQMRHKLTQLKAVFSTGVGGDHITTIEDVTIPGFLVNMTTETGVLSNAGASNQVIAFPPTPNDTMIQSSTRTVFTGNPPTDPTIISIGTLTVGAKTLNDVKATFAKKLQSGVSYTLRMKIGESPDIKDDRPPTGFIPYIGAFWKAHQTGERLIHIPRAPLGGADGAWTAQVIVGKEWIRLDTQMSSDNNIGWRGTGNEANVDNGNDSGFDTNHAVSSISTFVNGHLRENGSNGYKSGDENIYFRIGLTGFNPDPTPRYGMVLLTYADNKLRQRIWIRQGEDADYLMRPDDVFSSSTRPEAQKFSPYNLTDPYGNSQTDYNSMAYGTGLLGANGGTFVDYPSQAGYFFQWNNSTRAFNPYLPTVNNWNTYFGNIYWDAYTDETCPTGYRRPQDGRDTLYNTIGLMVGSEIRQSLWLTPKVSSIPSIDNSVCGYYADGFFDRRTITNGPGTYSETNTSVSVGDNQIAHIGRLFFNPANYASLFFPSAGYRGFSGNLQDVGHMGYYWTTTTYDANEAWYYAHNHDVLAAMLYGYRSCSNSVRCVYDTRSISVSPQNLYFTWNSTGAPNAQTITVLNDFPNWYASVTYHQGSGWLNITPTTSSNSSSNVSVVPNSDNNGSTPRTATVSIKTGYANSTLLVTQNNKTHVVLTYSQNSQATIPAKATSVTGEVWGGGGGGGGIYSGSGVQANGGGGGGGAYALKKYIAGVSLSLTVGTGGLRGENNANGFPGNTSKIVINSSTDPAVIANGGDGGQHTNGQLINSHFGNGGSGGTATGGDINLSGQNGGNHNSTPPSYGGASGNGTGPATASPPNGNHALPGNPPGGGGSGSRDVGFAVNQPGAKGADGLVVISYDLSLNITGANIYTTGTTLQLSVANPDAALNYIWRRNGGASLGTGAILTIPNVSSSNEGSYTVEYTYNHPNAIVSGSGTGISFSSTTYTFTSAAHNVTVIP